MIVRLWRVQISAAHRPEFEHIGEEHVAPLLELQEGFGGCLFLFQENEATLMTMWRDRAAAEQFSESPEALELGAQIRDRGLLRGEPRIEIFDVAGGSFKGV